jgi:ribosomal-protein-serine acetyltransferase
MPKFHVSEFVFLRTLTVADAQSLFSLVDNNRAHLREWLPWLDDNTRVEDSLEFIKSTPGQHSSEMGLQCGIFYNETLVGMCGYHPVNRSNNSVTIGYWVARNMTGKGIVTSCTKYLIDYAFDKLRLNKVYIPVAEKNLKSRAVSERLG